MVAGTKLVSKPPRLAARPCGVIYSRIKSGRSATNARVVCSSGKETENDAFDELLEKYELWRVSRGGAWVGRSFTT